MLKAFVAAGANVNVEYSPAKGTRLTLLAQKHTWIWPETAASIEQMTCLLGAGANPNQGTVSALANSVGACGEGGCSCNPGQIELLVQHGAKLRKGDAAVILEVACDASSDDMDTNDGCRLLRLWTTLPVPFQERRILLRGAIQRFSAYHDPVEEDEKDRLQTLSFLRRELQKTQKGSKHR